MLTIPNGFLPIIRDDGQEIACGFNQVLAVALPSGAVTPVDFGGPASAAGYHHGQIVGSKYLTATTRDLIGGPMPIDVNQCPGKFPTLAVVRGHVVSSIGGQHFIDGASVSYDPGQSDIETNDGQHYGYKPHNVAVPWPFFVRDVATQHQQIWIANDITNAAVWTDATGRPWVMANRGGRAEIYNSDGLIYQFPSGEMRGVLSDGPGEPWAWTCGQIGANPFIYGRPVNALSGAPVVTLQGMWWAGLAVVWKPAEGRWLVAGYYDGPGGTLYIEPNAAPAGTPVPPDPIPTPPQTIAVTVKAGETLTILVKGVA